MTSIAPAFDQYRRRYKNIRLEREDGILTMTVHTEGASLVWSAAAHEELGHCFADIGHDRQNKVVILTGEGTDFCARIDSAGFQLDTVEDWDLTLYEGRRLLTTLMDIEIPIISAVNGPARIHAEIPALSDIVIACDGALFQDAAHFTAGFVPGDGAHVIWPHLIGPNRARYFLLTGQELTASQALDYGIVSEVTSREALLPRAWALARDIAAKPMLTRRYTRLALTDRIKSLLHEGLKFGLAVEALAGIDHLSRRGKTT